MRSTAIKDARRLLHLLDAIAAKLEFARGFELPAAILLLELAERPDGAMVLFDANQPRPANLSPPVVRRLIEVLSARGLVRIKPLGKGASQISLDDNGLVLVEALRVFEQGMFVK